MGRSPTSSLCRVLRGVKLVRDHAATLDGVKVLIHNLVNSLPDKVQICSLRVGVLALVVKRGNLNLQTSAVVFSFHLSLACLLLGLSQSIKELGWIHLASPL